MNAAGIADAFLSDLRTASWFAAVGTPLGAGEREAALIYARGLEIEAEAVTWVAGWRDIGARANDPAMELAWWEREEALYRGLKRGIADTGNEGEANRFLTDVAALVGETALAGAMASLAREGTSDAALARVAAGAAGMACNHAATATVAGLQGHVFQTKLGLFQAGRMIVGVSEGQVYLA